MHLPRASAGFGIGRNDEEPRRESGRNNMSNEENAVCPGQVLAHPSGIYMLVSHLVIPGLYDVTEYHLVEREGSVIAREGESHRGVDECYLAKLKPAPAPVAQAVLDRDAYKRAYDEEFAKHGRDLGPDEMCDVVRQCHVAAGKARDRAREARKNA